MMATDLSVGTDTLELSWADGTSSAYSYIWLRDNCPEGLHPQTHERMLDLMSIEHDPRPRAARIEDGAAIIEWNNEDHVSRYSFDWLAGHRHGQAEQDLADIPALIWRSELGAAGIARHQAARILYDDTALLDWMRDTARTGLSIVTGVTDDREAGIELARRIGFLRETNFGVSFEVINRPDPNNLAFTAERLPLHTDLPNHEVPPGFQFLHCIANDAEGGGSEFADGFAIAEDLRREEPEAFDLLSRVAIPFRFHDSDTDIRIRRPVISLDGEGRVIEIRFNAHIAGVFDMPADTVAAYYRAYRAFMSRTRRQDYMVTLKLRAGELVVFDNRRILHGRERFDPNTGYRHLRGCYVDRGEFSSRLRVLACPATD